MPRSMLPSCHCMSTLVHVFTIYGTDQAYTLSSSDHNAAENGEEYKLKAVPSPRLGLGRSCGRRSSWRRFGSCGVARAPHLTKLGHDCQPRLRRCAQSAGQTPKHNRSRRSAFYTQATHTAGETSITGFLA
eukprot:scaffold144187_cov39-Prasinocladus_malaysianus.AAC.1